LIALLSAAALTGQARADEWRWGGKLDLTRGVASVEGAGGGGLAVWSLITGDETKNGIGGEASATYISLPAYEVRSYGVGVGFYDRLELTYDRQEFDTGATGAKLGLGNGFTFDQNVVGAKLRLAGDAVYDQDSWLPQIAVGLQYKQNDRDSIVHAVGARSSEGVDYYVAVTKILLDSDLVLSGAVRMTKANQTGLLGFGGDRNNSYQPQFEGSAGYLLTKRLLVGAEYRTKPNNLRFARESDWADVFAAYALNKSLSVTLAYVDLGDIATFKNQRGAYVSLQAGF